MGILGQNLAFNRSVRLPLPGTRKHQQPSLSRAKEFDTAKKPSRIAPFAHPSRPRCNAPA